MVRQVRMVAVGVIVALALVGVTSVGAADGLDTNKAVVSRFYDIFNAPGTSGLDDIMAANLVDHDPAPGQGPGLTGFKTKYAGFHTGFPDVKTTVLDLIAEGDRVTARVVATGTQKGPFNGLPATNKFVTFEVIDIYRVSDGKITDIWEVADILGLLTQLGVVPSSGPPSATPPASTVPKGTADLVANKAVALRFYDIFNAGAFDTYSQIVAADVIDHEPAPGQPQGIEGLKVALTGFKAGFPDIKVTPQDLIAEGDKVVVRSQAKGTNTGSFIGIPASGKPATLESIDIDRIVNGKIVEIWHIEDLFGLLIQIGAVPAPSAAPPPAAPAPSPAPAPVVVTAPASTGPLPYFIRRLGDG